MVLVYINLDSPLAILWFGPVLRHSSPIGTGGQFGVVLSELFPTWCRATAVNFCFNFARGVGFFGPYLIGAFAAKHGLAAAIGLTADLYLVALIALLAMPEPTKVDRKERRWPRRPGKASESASAIRDGGYTWTHCRNRRLSAMELCVAGDAEARRLNTLMRPPTTGAVSSN